MERAARVHEHVVELRKVLGDRFRSPELAGTTRRRCDGSWSAARADRLRTFILHRRAAGEWMDVGRWVEQQVTKLILDHRVLDSVGSSVPAEEPGADRRAASRARRVPR